MPEDGQYDRNM